MHITSSQEIKNTTRFSTEKANISGKFGSVVKFSKDYLIFFLIYFSQKLGLMQYAYCMFLKLHSIEHR